jgi:hypothetical protein
MFSRSDRNTVRLNPRSYYLVRVGGLCNTSRDFSRWLTGTVLVLRVLVAAVPLPPVKPALLDPAPCTSLGVFRTLASVLTVPTNPPLVAVVLVVDEARSGVLVCTDLISIVLAPEPEVLAVVVFVLVVPVGVARTSEVL